MSVGVLATLMHALIYAGLGTLPVISPLVANLGAFLCAFLISFAGHFVWTFREQTHGRRVVQLGACQFKFLLVALFGLVLNSILVWVVVDYLSLNYLLALVPMVFVVPLVTFFLSKRWVFR